MNKKVLFSLVTLLVLLLGAVVFLLNQKQTEQSSQSISSNQGNAKSEGGPDPITEALRQPVASENKPADTPVKPPPQNIPDFNKTDVDKSQLPGFMPKNIPVETAGELVQENFVVLVSDNRYQATRVFQSSRDSQELLALYRQWFKDNNWPITSDLSRDDLWALYSYQNGESLQVQWNKNSITGETLVDINFGYSAPN
jgi:hypothetical protein